VNLFFVGIGRNADTDYYNAIPFIFNTLDSDFCAIIFNLYCFECCNKCFSVYTVAKDEIDGIQNLFKQLSEFPRSKVATTGTAFAPLVASRF
jgi:hypothetical protein